MTGANRWVAENINGWIGPVGRDNRRRIGYMWDGGHTDVDSCFAMEHPRTRGAILVVSEQTKELTADGKYIYGVTIVNVGPVQGSFHLQGVRSMW
jgi:hypothetical protein